jgi:transglutaminase-like putative cysteine protease
VLYLIELDSCLRFEQEVREHHCELRLAPQESSAQKVLALHLEVEPAAELFHYIDCYGNLVHHCGVVAPHRALTVRLSAQVETLIENPFGYPAVSPARESEWIAETLRSQPRLWDYVLHRSATTPSLDPAILDKLGVPGFDRSRLLIESVAAVRDWIRETFDYEAKIEAPPTFEQMLSEKVGSSSAFAHLLTAIVRSWGVPARYVTGYCDLVDDEEEEDDADTNECGPRSWAEVLIPGAGWLGFDAVSGLVANDRYIAVAVGRDHADTVARRDAFKGEPAPTPFEVTLRLQRQSQSQQQ